MLFSSNCVATHEGVAYHRSNGTAQDILEINRSIPVQYGNLFNGERVTNYCTAAGQEQLKAYWLE
jgi:hypothetical protein